MQELGRLDWNLVPALHALLHERNVSRAARRLGVSQPAASAALARLRRRFDDPLLVRRGNDFVLTPLGEHLLPLARDAVAASRTMLGASPDFDHADTERTFSVAASDYGQLVLGPHLVEAVRRAAPRARLEWRFPFTERGRWGPEVLDRVDGWLAPQEVLHGHRSSGALRDAWACVVAGSDDDPVPGPEELAARRWVLPTVSGRPMQLQLDGLRAHGVYPQVQVTTEVFASIPFLVAGSDTVGLVQRRLAEQLAGAAGTRVLACPWPLPPATFTLWWAEERVDDPAHRWFRELVAGVLARLDPDDVPGTA